MDPKPYKNKRQPEAILQESIIKRLRFEEWIVIPTHGSKFQSGLPDLVAMHIRYPWKFIEVKRDDKFSFTAAQEQWFPIIKKVWIMASPDHYHRIFKKPNWQSYYLRVQRHKKKKYEKPAETRAKDKNADDIALALKMKGYKVMHTHGNVFQKGLPDLFCVHPDKGIKWVEVKREQHTFTGAQLQYLPYMKVCKFPCWILTAPSQVKLLDQRPNIGDYL